MQDPEITDHEGGKEPVAEMHKVVVVEVVPYISWSELAIVIVGVLTFRHILVKTRIKVTQKLPAILGSVVQHHDYEAEVDQ